MRCRGPVARAFPQSARGSLGFHGCSAMPYLSGPPLHRRRPAIRTPARRFQADSALASQPAPLARCEGRRRGRDPTAARAEDGNRTGAGSTTRSRSRVRREQVSSRHQWPPAMKWMDMPRPRAGKTPLVRPLDSSALQERLCALREMPLRRLQRAMAERTIAGLQRGVAARWASVRGGTELHAMFRTPPSAVGAQMAVGAEVCGRSCLLSHGRLRRRNVSEPRARRVAGRFVSCPGLTRAPFFAMRGSPQ